MTLPLDPKRTLPLCYEFLRSTPPFRGWRLPPASEVVFKTARSRHYYGAHEKRRGQPHTIEISEVLVGYNRTLVEIMAHEMVHVAQRIAGAETPGAEHNADFDRRWRRVCRYHGFDPKIWFSLPTGR